MENLIFKIFGLIIWLGLTISCKSKKNLTQSEGPLKTNSVQDSDSNHVKEIWISSYTIGEDNSIQTIGEINKIYYKKNTNEIFSLYSEENIESSRLIEFAQDSSLKLGKLIDGNILKNVADKSLIQEGCYSSAVSFNKNIFYLDPFKDIEPIIVGYDQEIEINFTGIICINNIGSIIAAASNNVLLDRDLAIENFIKFLDSKGLEHFRSSSSYNLSFKLPKFLKKNQIKTSKSYAPLKIGQLANEKISYPKAFEVEVLGNKEAVSIGSRKRLAEIFLNNIDIVFLETKGVTRLNDGVEFTLGKKLGSGSFGEVHEVHVSKNGLTATYALKIFKKADVDAKKLIRTNNSAYFLRNYGFSTNRRYQLTEIGGQNIGREFDRAIFNGQNEKSIAKRGELFHDLFDGISVLHRKKWYSLRKSKVHWDLKPSNLLLGLDGRVKIIDLDEVSVPTSAKKAGSPLWMPPERLSNPNKLRTGTETDIFAAGIMMLKAKYGIKSAGTADSAIKSCCDRNAIETNSINNLLNAYSGPYYNAIKRKANSLPEGPEKLEMHLIADMINPNPNRRPNIEQVKSRWNIIYPRPNKAHSIAQSIFHQQ